MTTNRQVNQNIAALEPLKRVLAEADKAINDRSRTICTSDSNVHKYDFLLTWSCLHLANANKFGHIRRPILPSPHRITAASPATVTVDLLPTEQFSRAFP